MKKSNEYIMVLALFIIFTIVFTWPLALHPTSSIPGDYGDPLLNTWILAHDARSFTSPGSLFQGNIMYPARDVITYSEHLFSMAVVAAPVYWLTGNPILAYNFLLLFGFVLSAFGMYLLLRYLTGNRWAGLAAGVFFAFVPYKISQITHIQICFSAFLPFTLLYLHKFFKRRQDQAPAGLWGLLPGPVPGQLALPGLRRPGRITGRRREDLPGLAAYRLGKACKAGGDGAGLRCW